MPDCRKEEYRKYYLVSFSVCLLWLAITSFLMVDLAAKIGDCIGLSASITGLTLLAIGASTAGLLFLYCGSSVSHSLSLLRITGLSLFFFSEDHRSLTLLANGAPSIC